MPSVYKTKTVSSVDIHLSHYLKKIYRSHGFGPLSVAALQDLDALEIAADLNQIADRELLLEIGIGAGRRRARHFGQHGRIEGPSVAARIRYDNVVVFVDADHAARGTETLEHAVGPSAVAMLQRLHDF